MIVPIKDDNSKNAWVFLKPLTWDLWMTSGCFFIFIGFVVWVLEHRINVDFRGPPHYQVGTSFWYSFSTMVFAQSKFVSNFESCLAQKEHSMKSGLVTNMERKVIICFVVCFVIFRGKSCE